MAASPMSLREAQLEAVRVLLSGEASQDDSWKVLVYDSYCRDIIAPLMHVGDLRKLGVTLYLELHSDRQPVRDAVAVYFVRPTTENIARLSRDLAADLYDAHEVNFVSPVPAVLLDQLAGEALASGTVAKIRCIHDQYLGFVALDEHVFTLHHSGSYERLNARGVSDRDIEAYVDAIVDGLFAVCATAQITPLIRARPGGPAGMVAERLAARVREARLSGSALFDDARSVGAQRAVLLLLDRSVDLAVMLQHGWTYQALAHDVLDYKLNKVSVESAGASADGAASATAARGARRTVVDLDSSDSFWAEHAASPFPEIGPLVEAMVAEYAALVGSVKALRDRIGEQGDSASALMGESRDIASNLTEHTERKRVIDVHTNVAGAILHAIEERALDTFFFAEESLRDGETPDVAALSQLVESSGSVDDKLRLYLVCAWTAGESDPAALAALAEALTRAGVDPSGPASHLKQIKAMQRLVPRGAAAAKSRAGLSWSQLVRSGKSLLKLTGADAWMPSNNVLPVARLAAALVDRKPSDELSAYMTLDTRAAKPGPVAAPAPTELSDVFVFVVGGGNYIEAANVLQLLGAQSAGAQSAATAQSATGAPVAFAAGSGSTGRRVYYGASELAPPTEFLRQLQNLSGTGTVAAARA